MKSFKKRENEERKRIQDALPTKNQPQPKIWTVTLFDPKPRDKIGYYIVSSVEKVDLKRVANGLAVLFGFDVYVFENVLNSFDVYLAKPVEFRFIEEYTLKVLSEI